ncbi:CcdC protein domain-containing protein [Rhizorhabdus argentea]|uniref:CcdC protein domain-containing protein n=1 Tax=Rhizorhabdus argentea TaxID=1387174 RepID=UPI0030EF534C
MISSELAPYAIAAPIVAVALFVRFRRIGRAQRLRLSTLWIIPTIFILLAGAVIVQFPPSGWGWLWVTIALVLGSAIGWQRGRLVEIAVDPETGLLNQRSSRGALLFLGLLMLLRWGLRALVEASDARWHLGAMLVSSIFIAFAAGVLSAYRVEIYLRARGLLRSG